LAQHGQGGQIPPLLVALRASCGMCSFSQILTRGNIGGE
jgi:hypothetical protein